MKLSKTAMGILKDRKVKQRIAQIVNVTENTVYAWIKTESDNLTKAAIVDYFIEEFNLSIDQILDRETQAASTKIQQVAA